MGSIIPLTVAAQACAQGISADAQVDRLVHELATRALVKEHGSPLISFHAGLDDTTLQKPRQHPLDYHGSLVLAPSFEGTEAASSETHETGKDVCRICFEDEGHLISPCVCTGSQKWVHPQCLRRWELITLQRHSNQRGICRVCKTQYSCSLNLQMTVEEMPALLIALRSSDQEVQADAAANIANLAIISLNQDVIREAGGVQALIQVLREGSQEAQAHAVNALRNLAQKKQIQVGNKAAVFWILKGNSQNQDLIREEGGIQALIKVLREGSQRAQSGAADALRILSWNDKNEGVICEEGGIQAMVDVLCEGNEEAREDVSIALWVLALNKQNLPLVREASRGPIRILRHGNPEAQANAVGALYECLKHLTHDWLLHHDMIRDGIQALISVLREGTQSHRAQANAASVLQRLSWNSDARGVIREEGGIQALMKARRDGNAETQAEASYALSVLAQVIQDKEIKRTEEDIQTLINFLREGAPEVQAEASYVLSILARSNQDEIREVGGIEALIRVLHDGGQAEADASGALSILARNRKNQALIHAARGIQALIKVVRDGNPEAQARASQALSTLAEDSHSNAVIREEGGIRALVALLGAGSHVDPLCEATAEASSTLLKLARNCQNQAVIREEGGIQALIHLLSEGSSRTRANAASALRSLSWRGRNREVIREQGGPEALIKVLQEAASIPTQANAAVALWYLETSNVVGLAWAKANHCIQALAQVLR